MTKKTRRRLLALALAAPVAGFLVAASGVIPMRASQGHWGAVRWFLQFAMRRSIATQSLRATVPPGLDERGLVLKGAGHYETGCRSCHGAPGVEQSRVARRMLPPPPDLAKLERTPAELFYVVKHGMKFTGMPPWPTQKRDDEVWAVVAFLLAMPKLDAAGYERLVREAPRAAGASIPERPRLDLESCARCHGSDGRGRGSSVYPKLAGQRRDYLYASLQAYANDERPSGVMGPLAAPLSDEMVAALAAYYSRLPPARPSAPRDAEAAARGRALAERGQPDRKLPACAACHGLDRESANPSYPVLAGQPAEYLILQLQLFKSGARGGGGSAHLMKPVARALTEAQMRDAALYYESR